MNNENNKNVYPDIKDEMNSQNLVPIKGIFHNMSKTRIASLSSEIAKKKNQIRTMIVNELGIPKTTKRVRKPSALKRLEKGLKNLFFKKDGPVTQKFPKIRQEIIHKANTKHHSTFDTKINVGSLTYFYLKEGNIQNKTEAYINEYKKNVFERSNYFTVRKEKDPLLELNDVSNKIIERNRMNKTGFKLNQKMAKHIIKENPTLENDEDSSNCEMNTAPNVNNDHNISLINSNQNPNKNRNYYTANSYFKKSTYTSYYKSNTNNSSSISNTVNSPSPDIMKKEIMKKVNNLNNKQHKMEKKLFRIIDRAQNRNNMKKVIDKDLETILDAKIKKKKKFGQTREIYVQAVKIKDDYTLMDSKKAQLLKLSDSINNLTDEAAMMFADRLIEAYYAKTVAMKIDIPLLAPDIVKKHKNEQIQKIRNRINNNNEKLIRMGYNAEKEKQNLNKTYQKFHIH